MGGASTLNNVLFLILCCLGPCTAWVLLSLWKLCEPGALSLQRRLFTLGETALHQLLWNGTSGIPAATFLSREKPGLHPVWFHKVMLGLLGRAGVAVSCEHPPCGPVGSAGSAQLIKQSASGADDLKDH